MPSLIGAFFIESSTGSINTGDFNNISPKASSKSYSGQGSSNAGDFFAIVNGANATNTLDADVLDQPDVLTG